SRIAARFWTAPALWRFSNGGVQLESGRKLPHSKTLSRARTVDRLNACPKLEVEPHYKLACDSWPWRSSHWLPLHRFERPRSTRRFPSQSNYRWHRTWLARFGERRFGECQLRHEYVDLDQRNYPLYGPTRRRDSHEKAPHEFRACRSMAAFAIRRQLRHFR